MSIDLTQELSFVTDEIKSLEKMLRASADVLFHRPGKKLYDRPFIVTKLDENAYWEHYPHFRDDNKKHRFIALIGNYDSDFESIQRRQNSREVEVAACSIEECCDKAIELAKAADEQDFLSKCGDGYTGWFNHFDGSIGMGYGLELIKTTFPKLYIYSTHLYYGK